MARLLIMLCDAADMSVRKGVFPPRNGFEEDGLQFDLSSCPPTFQYDEAYCGPGQASLRTAEYLGIAPAVTSCLRQVDYGRWAGRSIKAIGDEEPEALATWLTEPSFAPPNGESVSSLVNRISEWMSHHVGGRGTILAIAPASVVRAAILVALEAPARCMMRLDVQPLARVEMTWSDRKWRLRAFGLD